MQNTTPLRWIEEAEARRVLTEAMSKPAPTLLSRTRLRKAAAQWRSAVRIWLAALEPTGCTALSAQPALVRRPAVRDDYWADDSQFSGW